MAQLAEEEIKLSVSELKRKRYNSLLLLQCLVGVDPASATYVKMKQNACARLGMESIAIELRKDTTTQNFFKIIEKLNNDSKDSWDFIAASCPSQVDERKCFDAINVEKDVDGVTCIGFGQMTMGEDAYGSCTPAGIMRILDHYKLKFQARMQLLLVEVPILGKPMAMMLLNKNATVTICHSKTKNLKDHIKNADILVGAVGVPRLIQKDWIKDSAVVIDAGYHPVEKCGDIDLEELNPLLLRILQFLAELDQ